MGKLRSFVKKHKTLKAFLLAPRNFKMWISKKRQEKVFLKKADKAIEETQEILKDIHNVGFFCFGTLLGITREKRILGRDLDIDVGIIIDNQNQIKDVSEYFIKQGFKLHIEYQVEDVGINQQSFDKNGVNIDVSYFFKDGDRLKTYLLYGEDSVLYFAIPLIRNKIELFNGMNIFVPDKQEEVLSCLYGEDWRVPNPKYRYWENKCATKIDNKGKTFIYDIKEGL